MFTKISAIFLAIVSGIPMIGCGKPASTDSMVEKVEKSDSLPTEVKLLVRAIADDDSVGFANMVSYPLQRPYPLRDIDGADQMKSYYKELVDDSLRNVITQAEPKRWSKYGWRGWTLDDGRYIWVDEGVYDVQYLSQKEIKMIDSLIREEILSIEPSIREGWKPILCLHNDSNGNVYRVDGRAKKNKNKGKHYRMAVYGANSDLRGLPAQLLDGDKEDDGSAGTVIYRFIVKPGEEILIEPESPETGNPVLIEHNDSVIPLKKAYWHELVRSHQ